MAGVWTTLPPNVGHCATVFVLYTLIQVDLKQKAFWSFGPTGSCERYGFLLDIASSGKLFCRNSHPVCFVPAGLAKNGYYVEKKGKGKGNRQSM